MAYSQCGWESFKTSRTLGSELLGDIEDYGFGQL